MLRVLMQIRDKLFARCQNELRLVAECYKISLCLIVFFFNKFWINLNILTQDKF